MGVLTKSEQWRYVVPGQGDLAMISHSGFRPQTQFSVGLKT